VSSQIEIGEVFLADFGDPVGHEQGYRRPAVVISPEQFNIMASRLAVVVPLTTTDRGLAQHVRLDYLHAGLDRPSVAKCEDLRSVSHQRLIRFIGRVTNEDLAEIKETVRMLLDM